MYNEKKNPKAMTWNAVALSLALIPPIGFIFIIKQCIDEKRNHEYGEDFILTPAVIVIAYSIFQLVLQWFISMTNSGAAYVRAILFAVFYGIALIGAFIMLKTRRHYVRLDENTDLFLTLVEKGYLTETAEIAEYMDTTRDKVEDLILYLLKTGMLEGFAFEAEYHRLKNTDPYKYFRFKCSYCGADQQLMRGRDITCPYCGNPVTVED